MAETYRLVIGAKFDGIHTDYLVLDTVQKKTVKASSKIASYPLQNGTTLSDHMYSEPDTVSFDGVFGIAGKNPRLANGEQKHRVLDVLDENGNTIEQRDEQGAYIRNYEIEGISGTSKDRLTNVQETFEYIKNNGILCDLMTIIEGDDQKVRFKKRKNMALRDITWTENLNSMAYNFSFYEIISLDVQQFEWEDYTTGCSLVLPEAASISEILFGNDKNTLYEIILKQLINENYITKNTANVLAVCSDKIIKQGTGIKNGWLITGAITSSIISLGLAAVGVMALIGGGLSLSAAIVPVGTVIAVAAVIAIVLWKVISSNTKEKKRLTENAKKGFKLIIDADKYFKTSGEIKDTAKDADFDTAEFNRLQGLLDDVEMSVNKLDSGITAYNLANTLKDNDEREVALTVGSNIYYIQFVKDTNNNWVISVTDGDGEPLTGSNGEKISSGVSLYSFDDCNRYTNSLFIDSTQNYEVYLINPSLNPEANVTEEEQNNIKEYLYGTQIIVSKGNIKSNMDKINQAIVDAIYNHNYNE